LRGCGRKSGPRCSIRQQTSLHLCRHWLLHGTFPLLLRCCESRRVCQRASGSHSRHSPFSLSDRYVIHIAELIHTRMYGLELWGCARKSNTSVIQRSQSKILRMIVDAPWYVSNATLHADLGISSVQDVIQQRSNKHHNKTKTHETPLLKTLLARDDNRRLKRNWPIDLI
jgi:hypothetical protein